MHEGGGKRVGSSKVVELKKKERKKSKTLNNTYNLHEDINNTGKSNYIGKYETTEMCYLFLFVPSHDLKHNSCPIMQYIEIKVGGHTRYENVIYDNKK